MTTLEAREAVDPFIPERDSRWYRAMRHFWHPVAYSKDVAEDQMVSGQLLGERILVVRHQGEVRAFMDVCRHKGAAPSLGWVENGCINCPYHGWAYDMDGTLVSIPSRPELNGVLQLGLVRYLCRESSGMVWVSLTDEPWGDPPGIPEWNDPIMRWQTPPSYDWATSSPRRLENFVDFSHFPFVHENVLGTRDKAQIEEHDVWREDGALRFDKVFVEPNVDRMKEMLGIDEDTMSVRNWYQLTVPGSISLVRTFPNGKRYALYMVTAPTGPATCRNFWHIGADFTSTQDDMDFLLEFEYMVLDQDQPVVESQWPEHLPDRLSAETYVKVADDITLAYRKWLFELAEELEPN